MYVNKKIFLKVYEILKFAEISENQHVNVLSSVQLMTHSDFIQMYTA